MNRRNFVLVSGLTLSGCATSPSLPLVSAVSPIDGCCNRLSEAAYIKYSGTSIVRIEISEKSPRFGFIHGESRFAALELDEKAQYGLIEVTTSVQGFFLPTATIYIPTLMFLDVSFHEIATVEPKFFQNTGKHDDSSWSTYYGACFVPSKAKYVLIFSDPKKLATNKVRHLNGGGLSADLFLNTVRDVYKRIDKSLYAADKVLPFDPERGFVAHDLSRQALGEFRVSFSPVSEPPSHRYEGAGSAKLSGIGSPRT
jgi:hypothetical protein